MVWEGISPGVYSFWPDCQAAIKGYSNAKFKSFPSLEAARKAFEEGPDLHWGESSVRTSRETAGTAGRPVANSLCVDAAWNTETKTMEYRGVWMHDKSTAFHRGPFENATGNIGEFLAVVHGLSLLKTRSLDWPIYSDSRTAISWVQKMKVRSDSMAKGKTSRRVNELVERAVNWLEENEYDNKILKWDTEAWGEIPADFGRK